MPGPLYSLGLDFGTNTARALIVDIRDGRELGAGVHPYPHGDAGVLTDPRDPNVARQHPGDYALALEEAVKKALIEARAADPAFDAARIVGIGIDATASTPIPVDARFQPLAGSARFQNDLNAMAWLWKDHTAHAEAAEITRTAARTHPEYLAKCGGAYSSEWFFSKLLHCLRAAPQVMAAADGWIEQGDYIAGLLTGAASPKDVKRNACAAGHKAMYNPAWGLPSLQFLTEVDPKLGDWCRGRLYEKAYSSDVAAGLLSRDWAERLGLKTETPVAVAAIDAHLGAVGAGIKPGTLVKILGTSGCDMLIHPEKDPLPDIPGICGIAHGSIVPGFFGLEAGQSAVGDIFGWFTREFGKPAGQDHASLTREAERLRPGESGLLALDWHNGNRNVLADPRLTGLIVGLTLQTKPAEVYRALLESTAFGARIIMERFEEHKVPVHQVIVSGGIADKNPVLLQIYADITGRPIQLSRSAQTCALGAAVYGAVVGRGHPSVEAAQRHMTGLKEAVYKPNPKNGPAYGELFRLYRRLHDAFGLKDRREDLSGVMKKLIELREDARI